MKKAAAALLALTLAGCTTPFYKSTSGIFLDVGISVPNEEELKLQLVSYVSGEKVRVMDPSRIDHMSRFTATNEYFWGMIKINENRVSHIYVIPTNSTDGAEIVTNCLIDAEHSSISAMENN